MRQLNRSSLPNFLELGKQELLSYVLACPILGDLKESRETRTTRIIAWTFLEEKQ